MPLGFTPLTGDALTVRISKVRQATTVDRRYGEVTELPVGVATIAINGVAPLKAAKAVDTGCRNDLLRLDGRPLPVRVTGTSADLLAGKDAKIVPCSTAPLRLAKGTHRLTAAPGLHTGIDLDQVVLRSSALTAAKPLRRPPPTPARRPRWPTARGHGAHDHASRRVPRGAGWCLVRGSTTAGRPPSTVPRSASRPSSMAG